MQQLQLFQIYETIETVRFGQGFDNSLQLKQWLLVWANYQNNLKDWTNYLFDQDLETTVVLHSHSSALNKLRRQ